MYNTPHVLQYHHHHYHHHNRVHMNGYMDPHHIYIYISLLVQFQKTTTEEVNEKEKKKNAMRGRQTSPTNYTIFNRGKWQYIMLVL